MYISLFWFILVKRW